MIADELLRDTVQFLRGVGVGNALRRRIEAYLTEFAVAPAAGVVDAGPAENQKLIVEKLTAWYNAKRTPLCQDTLALANRNPRAAQEMWNLYNGLLIDGREDPGLRLEFFDNISSARLRELERL